MSAAIKLGSATDLVFGGELRKPIIGIPVGVRARLRLRPNCFGEIFIKTADGITRHLLKDAGDSWVPGPTTGQNKTLQLL